MIENHSTFLLKKVFTYIFLLLMICISLFPITWMIDSSFKGPDELFRNPPTYRIVNFIFDNYVRVIFQSQVPRTYLNSIIISVSATFLTLCCSVLAGYGLSRYRFKGKSLLSTSLLYGQMMPACVLIIPLYLSFSRMGLIDKYISLILPDMAITIPLSTLMLKAFMDGVPVELDQAARIDGCNVLQSLIRIIIPIASPGMIAVSVYAFLTTWEEFLFALNLTSSIKSRTVPIAVNAMRGEYYVDWGGIMAAGVLVALPVLLLFLSFNKYFVKGLSEGSVKG
jgi:ABC-type glycerol-3-phosphate transport system permease component